MASAFTGIDHVGIAVADLDVAVAAYERLTGSAPSHRQVVASDGIEAVMFEVGSVAHRAARAAPGRSPRSRASWRGAAAGSTTSPMRSTDVQASLDGFAELGLQLLDTCPRQGAAGRLVAFLHPSAGAGVLTELCQPDQESAGSHA